MVQDSLVKRFNLQVLKLVKVIHTVELDEFSIDEKVKFKTPFGSIKIEVLDKNPKMQLT